jgi:hypothetical protein
MVSADALASFIFICAMVAIVAGLFGYSIGIQAARRRLIKLLDHKETVSVSLSELLIVVEEGSRDGS